MGQLLEHFAEAAGETIRIKKGQHTEVLPENQEYVNTVTEAAKSGDVSAMLALGNHYQRGKYVNYDPNMAIYWWEEAAKRGDSVAQYNLGLMYNGDLSKLHYNSEKAAYWLALSAQNGYRDAQIVLQEEFKWSRLRNKWIRK